MENLKLEGELELQLWTYPVYRAYVESPLDLAAEIPSRGSDLGVRLIEDTLKRSNSWIEALEFKSALEPHESAAKRGAKIPWLRFRADLLKRIGRRPLGPAY